MFLCAVSIMYQPKSIADIVSMKIFGLEVIYFYRFRNGDMCYSSYRAGVSDAIAEKAAEAAQNASTSVIIAANTRFCFVMLLSSGRTVILLFFAVQPELDGTF